MDQANLVSKDNLIKTDNLNLVNQDNLVKQVKVRNLNQDRTTTTRVRTTIRTKITTKVRITVKITTKVRNLNPLNKDSKVNLAIQADQVYQAMGSLEAVVVMEMAVE